MKNQDYQDENIERRYLRENMQNYQFLKVKNSLLEFEKDFIQLKDRESKIRKEKLKRDIKGLFHKPLIVSKDDMDKFEEQIMKKIRPIITKWFDQVINKNVMDKKPKIISDKLKDKIFNDIWTLFQTKNKKERNNQR